MVASTHNVIWDGGNAHFISWIRGFAYNNSNTLSKIHPLMRAEAVAPTYNVTWDGGDIRFISWVRGIAYNNSNPLATILLLFNLVQGWKYKLKAEILSNA